MRRTIEWFNNPAIADEATKKVGELKPEALADLETKIQQMVEDAFVDGYMFALSSKRVYSEAFNLSEHMLKAHVIEEALLYHKKIEDDRRGKARILLNKFSDPDRAEELRSVIIGKSLVNDPDNFINNARNAAKDFVTANGEKLSEKEIFEMGANALLALAKHCSPESN